MNRATKTDLLYWITILSACTMGETAADFLSHGPLGLGYALASVILGSLVVGALFLERLARVPNALRYWTTIIIMATAGTTMADWLSRTLELGYFRSSALLGTLFVAILLAGRNGRLSPRRAELASSVLPHIEIEQPLRRVPTTDARYWAAIMAASTLGTTLGDYFSDGVELGFGTSSLVLFALLAMVLAVELRARMPNEARYWTALIIASTIGATSGDFVTKDEGLDLGYFWGNGLIIGVFVCIAVARRLMAQRAPQHQESLDGSLLPRVELP